MWEARKTSAFLSISKRTLLYERSLRILGNNRILSNIDIIEMLRNVKVFCNVATVVMLENVGTFIEYKTNESP